MIIIYEKLASDVLQMENLFSYFVRYSLITFAILNKEVLWIEDLVYTDNVLYIFF